MAGPQEVTLRGRRPASHADREQAIGTLKAGFVHGRLTKDEFDARIAQALGCVTYAELAALTADLPARSPPPPPRPVSNALRWAASGFMTPAALAAAFLLASVRGAGGAGAVALVFAFGYFLFWLSAGANMLWEWHCMSLPGTAMCVRCAHTAAAHRRRSACTVRLGSLRRCLCAGYVPPGTVTEDAPRAGG
jgi:hypothetical protein